jgi:hypothetical protein
MALFGLSPLFLSLLASTFFTTADTGLDVAHFLKFLAIFAGAIQLFGALNLKTPLVTEISSSPTDDPERSNINERTALLPGKSIPEAVAPANEDGSAFDLFQDSSFWILAVIVLVNLGLVSSYLYVCSDCCANTTSPV